MSIYAVWGPPHSEPHPVKRTVKNYKIFPDWQLRLSVAFYAARES